MGEPLRIVIADDNYLVREGTRRLLEDSGQVTVLAAVGSAPELLDAVRRAGLREAAAGGSVIDHGRLGASFGGTSGESATVTGAFPVDSCCGWWSGANGRVAWRTAERPS
ncbi:MAG TPA: hypothetical protein VJS86_04540 [Arthrobacter sp.]|nr:hypothetical protein [Arthrobacter sp.]